MAQDVDGPETGTAEEDSRASPRRLFTVFGGTGFLGCRVVSGLLRRGHHVRIAARHPERPDEAAGTGRAEPVEADLFDPASLSRAMDGADGVVNAVSLYVEKGTLTFHAVHVEGARRLARLAAETGVPRLVHVSGIGSDPHAADSYIRARGEGEAAVREAFPAAIIVRSAVMFGPDDAFLGAIRRTVRRAPIYPLFGRGETRLQPVHVSDVAEGIARLLISDDPAQCHEFAGPQVYSYRELVEAVARASGRRSRTVPVPFALWRLLATAAEHLPGAPLTRNQVALMQRDNVADEDLPGLAQLGTSPRPIEAELRSERS